MAEDGQGRTSDPKANAPEPAEENVFAARPPSPAAPPVTDGNPAPVGTESPVEPPARQPLTPRGLARFANAAFPRLLVVELVVASLVILSGMVVLTEAIFPVIRSAVENLPETGAIQNGTLFSPQLESVLLAEGPQLSIVLDADERKGVTPVGDLVVEFQRMRVQICSLFGCRSFAYPVKAAFGRTELQPWWTAWEPNLYWLLGAGGLVVLLLNWTLLAALYAPGLRLLAYFRDRQLSWLQAWKVSVAALMPGALVLALGIAAYGLGWINLVRLLLLWPIHFVVGWIYLLLVVRHLPRVPAQVVPGTNPFSTQG